MVIKKKTIKSGIEFIVDLGGNLRLQKTKAEHYIKMFLIVEIPLIASCYVKVQLVKL